MCVFLFFRFRLVPIGLFLLLVKPLGAQPATWTGGAGTENWNDAGNWTAAAVPGPGAAVVLDNRSVPGSFRVQLPDVPVTLQSLAIRPGTGRTIELLLPPGNTSNDALVITGSGYPFLLGSGAVFRNACGISSGTSIDLADSFRIENGGRYIHSTRGTHAASLLAKLSSAPGTERGVFEFDVPRASYTISVSNRTYGTLALRSTALGQPVNYTCSGSNPLLVRGNLDIGEDVSLSIDLATAKGNVTVEGDLLQQTGTLTLGSGGGDSTRLMLHGNFIQQEAAVLTSAVDAFPGIVLNGSAAQSINASGVISGKVALVIDNTAGVSLLHPLFLSTALKLSAGAFLTSSDHLLTLGDTCLLETDTLVTGTFIDGPLCRHIAAGTVRALFPVGAGGARRWLALREAAGIFTAQYFADNPALFAAPAATGIDHVSSKEYWLLQSSGSATGKVELSHAVPQSGTITDPAVLRVARLLQNQWRDAGESAFTGDLVSGSVISEPVNDFSGNYFTLGSSLSQENPLPLESVSFEVRRESGQLKFSWTWSGPEVAAGFEIMRLENGGARTVTYQEASGGTLQYGWVMPEKVPSLASRWRIDLIDKQGKRYPGKSVLLPELTGSGPKIFITDMGNRSLQLIIQNAKPGNCALRLYSASGAMLWQETKFCVAGENRWPLRGWAAAGGVYFLRLDFADDQRKTLRILL